MIFAELFQDRNRWVCLLAAAWFLAAVPLQSARATAAFARQTGMSCAACHMQSYGPWLTPVGQKFKLDGYVAGHANKLPDLINAFSLETVGSLTNTQKDVPVGQYYDNQSGQSKPNNNVVDDWTALYYTGRVTDNIGSYLQLNFNPQVGRAISLAMADIRFANHFSFKDNEVAYGITVNNAPTMSDYWMSTYAWMYPYTQSSVTVKPAAQPWLQSLMEGANTAGATAYTMINNHLYLEAGAYTSQSQNMAKGLGVWNDGSQSSAPLSGLISGGAPYWRVFLQHTVGQHNMMVGAFGLSANVFPFYDQTAGTDSYSEFNVDANYSYMLNEDHMLMGMARFSHDSMKMTASQRLGFASNSRNHLDSLMVMGMWTYRQTYSFTAGWNYMSGSRDLALYNGAVDFQAGEIDPIDGSANGSPNTNAFLFEADYVPFGKGTSNTDPFLNLRFSLQYWAYTQFNGSRTDYSGSGRRPEANNTLYLVGNLMF